MLPTKRNFRSPKSAEEEKRLLEGNTPKSTQYVTKWAFKMFKDWQLGRNNKDPSLESTSSKANLKDVQSLETNQ